MKAYPTYKDSGVVWIGEIPEHWVKKKLGHSIDTIVPMRDKPTHLKGEIPWIRIEDFEGKYIYGSKSNQGVTNELVDKMNLKIYPVGTVLTTCSCSFGTSMIVKIPMTSNQTFIGLVPKKNDLFEEYLFYQLKIWEGELERLLSGSIQKYLSRDNFKSLSFLFPPLEEQTTIANFLDHKTAQIDAAIRKHRQLIELLQEHRAALINEAVTKGINPNVPMKNSGIEWIGEIPEHWELRKMKFLIDKIIGGGTPSTGNKKFWNGNIPWVSPKDMKCSEITGTQDYITQLGVENSSTNLVDPGAILIVFRSGILKHTLPVATNFVKVALNQDMKAIRPKTEVLGAFFNYLHRGLENEILTFCSKVGATVDSLDMHFYLNFLVPFVPTMKEQEQIVRFIESETTRIDNELKLAQQEINLLEEYRQSLIAEAVTGKIDVRDYTLT